ncbi:MAG TPA: FAD-dependent oxidoreductase [Sphingomicrobium sp.]|nr:FAD-dependent oxidoreductase [Sphingomicrobium sp.]
MLLDRRTFAVSSAALLGGCATLGTRRPAGANCTPLPPVLVDEDRVIRTVAGLRPYRRSGFVVRAEQLGTKRVVHNYGHGGAGITLSWGTSKLATDLGLTGHSGPVAVVGGGIMGLTTARLVQEAGLPVTVYAKDFPPHTTSNVAGGQIAPFGHFSEDAVTPEWRRQFLAAMDYSWRRFQIMVGDDYGIRWLPTYEETSRTVIEAGPLSAYSPNLRLLGRAEHPFPLERVLACDTMYVETGRYLRKMLLDLQTAGGKLQRREFLAPQALAELPETLIFNCTGIGARALFGDSELIPVRGQLAVLLPQPEIRYAASGEWGYMFPRSDGILLGGTFERDVWDTTPDPAAIARIIERHKHFFSGFRCAA